MTKRVPWSREDILVAYALYCIIPLNKINASNKLIQQVAENFPHSLASLVMRMQNFSRIDPNSQKKGLAHAAKGDYIIFEEFRHDWGNLSYLAEQITGLTLFDADPINGAKPISSLTNHRQVSRERHFFRSAVFAAYDNKCCISGLSLPRLLAASHIKPYRTCRSSSERTDPTNGLLLNTFYDKAFDSGLITVDTKYIIHVSDVVKEYSYNEFTRQWLVGLESNQIIRPERFAPQREFLEYHNDIIFRRC